jgi:hypothetical protein
MKQIFTAALAITVFVSALAGQTSSAKADKERIEGGSPKEVVDELWSTATRGELLTPEGWDKASRTFFTNPAPPPGNKVILVVSNYWGPAYEMSRRTDTVDVAVGYIDCGKIDSALVYTPAPKTDAVKTGMLYHLITTPTYSMMYGHDGKTVVEKKPLGSRVWRIQGSPGLPRTTVNTAIRYVLQMRKKTKDPVVRQNADRTLNELMKLQ